jgi:hypothetical protein
MPTLFDMLKWQSALNRNVSLSSEIAKKAFRKYKLNIGEELI